MKIRTALVLAFFVLSVVPLGVIVLYSHFASSRALKSAYQAEATRMTAQMDRRLGNIRDELQQRLAEVSALPDPSEGNVLMTMGDAASYVDSIEIHPTPSPSAAPAAAPAPLRRMIIRIPPIHIPRFTLSGDQRDQLKKISTLGNQMRSPILTDEQRKQVEQELKLAQTAFNESMQQSQKEFSKSLDATMKQQATQHEAQMRAVEERRDAAIEAADAQREKAQLDAEARADAADAAADPDTPAPAGQPQLAPSAPELAPSAPHPAPHSAVDVVGQRVDVGNLQAHVSTPRIIRRVLNTVPDDASERDEIAFAIDQQGSVYTRTQDERQRLDAAGISERIKSGKPLSGIQNWAVVTRRDPDSGLQIGVARPFGQDLEDLRKTAGKNFGFGMALILIAMIGIVPVANHITGDVELVTRGAERIAHGDLTTRLPVHSNNEIGQLATAFNRMAKDLSLQQQRIVEQERAAIEYERKSAELEEARRFQLSMLPKEVPHLDAYDVAVFTHTATEVGGDYYDFDVDDGGVAITIGDATGHGARAGTMVAVIKALFAGYGGEQPSEFLRGATEKIRRMDLGRMAMALLVARFQGRQVTVASAGMPPAYVHRHATGAVEEVSVGATPLGTMGDDYRDARVELSPGDTMLFMSDGFPELMNADGQQLGYSAAIETFAAAANAADADAVIASLETAVRKWHGDQPPNDDVTFVVVRAREARSFSA